MKRKNKEVNQNKKEKESINNKHPQKPSSPTNDNRHHQPLMPQNGSNNVEDQHQKKQDLPLATINEENQPAPAKSRSPIALHQRCGMPAQDSKQGFVVSAHTSKAMKQDLTNGKVVSTIATGRIGPINITVRASCQQNGGSVGIAFGGESNGEGNSAAGPGGTSSMNGGGAGASAGGQALVKIQARKVNCKSSDGQLFVVDWYLMQQSKLFKLSWEEHRTVAKKASNGRSRKFIFTMDSVDAPTFRWVLEWLVQHDGMDDPVVREDPVTGDRLWFELTEFERRFFDKPVDIINNLLNAGKSLDIPSLYMFGCQAMASILQTKSPSDIREMLGLDNDLSSSDIAAIRRKNRKYKMRELKTIKYANRLQQLQSQLGQMDVKDGGGGTNADTVEVMAKALVGSTGGGGGYTPEMKKAAFAMRDASIAKALPDGKKLTGRKMAEQLLMASGRDILTG